MHPTNNVVSDQHENRKNLRNYAKWLQTRVSDITWAVKDELDGWRWGNNKKRIVTCYNANGLHCRRLPLKIIEAHLRGDTTLYYTGAWRKSSAEILGTIDIDVGKSQNKGTPEGARACAEFLKNNFSGLCAEPSTHGKGVHCSFVVERGDHSTEEVRDALKQFQTYLEDACKDFDIEKVEIKGLSPVLYWDRTGDESYLKDINCGTLCKLPRMDVRSTVHFTVEQLQAMKPAAGPVAPRRAGSCMPIPENYTENMKHYRSFANRLLCEYEFDDPTGREIITKEDVAVSALAIHYCSDHMNEDGTMPHARIEAVWTALRDAGVTKRAFSNKRFKIIRDTFIDIGYIDVHDPTYFFYGNGKKGRAAKWQASERCVEAVEAFCTSDTETTTTTSLREHFPEKQEQRVRLVCVLPPHQANEHLRIDLTQFIRPWDGPTQSETVMVGVESS